jgi:N-acetylglucosamine-6-phosphate deacetylase
MILDGADIVLPDRVLAHGRLVIEGDRIVDIGPGSPDGPLAGHVIVPGFVDVHVHGVEGHDVLEASDRVAKVAARLPRYGVTSFCPTTVACAPGDLRMVAQAVQAARRTPAAGSARVLPAHLESNFIKHDYRGAQPLACLCLPPGAPAADAVDGMAREFTGSEIVAEIAAHRDAVGIVTIAPELPEALPLIEDLVHHGHRVSLGHSGATYEQGRAGIAAGARHATHLFNRMPPFTHRAPGLVGAVLEDDRVAVEIVCDGYHVHPATMRAAIRAKQPARVMAITDGTAGSGLPVGSEVQLGGRRITVTDDACFLDDGTLAGSSLTMDRAFATLVDAVGVTLVDAALMTSTVPARELRLAGYGVLEAGAIADLVVLDVRHRVRQTLIGGVVAWDATAQATAAGA